MLTRNLLGMISEKKFRAPRKFSLNDLPYLRDHCLNDTIIVSAASLIEAIANFVLDYDDYSNLKPLITRAFTFSDFFFCRPLIIDPNNEDTVCEFVWNISTLKDSACSLNGSKKSKEALRSLMDFKNISSASIKLSTKASKMYEDQNVNLGKIGESDSIFIRDQNDAICLVCNCVIVDESEQLLNLQVDQERNFEENDGSKFYTLNVARKSINAQEFYAFLRSRGYAYGSAFQCVYFLQSIVDCQEETSIATRSYYGQCTLKVDGNEKLDVLIDGVFQAMVYTLLQEANFEEMLVPFSIGKLQILMSQMSESFSVNKSVSLSRFDFQSGPNMSSSTIALFRVDLEKFAGDCFIMKNGVKIFVAENILFRPVKSNSFGRVILNTIPDTSENVIVDKLENVVVKNFNNEIDNTANPTINTEAEKTKRIKYGIRAMSCRLPGNVNCPADFWKLLVNGTVTDQRIPTSRIPTRNNLLRARLVEGGNFLSQNVRYFDAAFFGISRAEAETMDPQQRILLECVHECMENAGLESLVGPTGTFVGVMGVEYPDVDGSDRRDMLAMLGSATSIIAGRINHYLGATGPAICLDTACSSSLVCMDLALQALAAGRCERALVAGVNLTLTEKSLQQRANGKMVSWDGACRTFDAHATGYGRADGCVVMLIERVDPSTFVVPVYEAIIESINVNHDGRSTALTAPNPNAQSTLIAECLRTLDNESLLFWECHGTGTSLGDPIEYSALKNALKSRKMLANSELILSSAKASIGHCEAASGLVGVLKAVLQLQNDYVPRMPRFRVLNEQIRRCANASLKIPICGRELNLMDSKNIEDIEIESFIDSINLNELNFIDKKPRDFLGSEEAKKIMKYMDFINPIDSYKTRIGGVSSFGVSGTNACAILSYYRKHHCRDACHSYCNVLPISAKSEESLETLLKITLKQISEKLHLSPNLTTLSNYCSAFAICRAHYRYRIAIRFQRAAENCNSFMPIVTRPAMFSSTVSQPGFSFVFGYFSEKSFQMNIFLLFIKIPVYRFKLCEALQLLGVDFMTAIQAKNQKILAIADAFAKYHTVIEFGVMIRNHKILEKRKNISEALLRFILKKDPNNGILSYINDVKTEVEDRIMDYNGDYDKDIFGLKTIGDNFYVDFPLNTIENFENLLAYCYVNGANLNWPKIYSTKCTYSMVHVQLPNYPFNRRDYWINRHTDSPMCHALIGNVVEYGEDHVTFENLLSVRRLPFIDRVLLDEKSEKEEPKLEKLYSNTLIDANKLACPNEPESRKLFPLGAILEMIISAAYFSIDLNKDEGIRITNISLQKFSNFMRSSEKFAGNGGLEESEFWLTTAVNRRFAKLEILVGPFLNSLAFQKRSGIEKSSAESEGLTEIPFCNANFCSVKNLREEKISDPVIDQLIDEKQFKKKIFENSGIRYANFDSVRVYLDEACNIVKIATDSNPLTQEDYMINPILLETFAQILLNYGVITSYEVIYERIKMIEVFKQIDRFCYIKIDDNVIESFDEHRDLALRVVLDLSVTNAESNILSAPIITRRRANTLTLEKLAENVVADTVTYRTGSAADSNAILDGIVAALEDSLTLESPLDESAHNTGFIDLGLDSLSLIGFLDKLNEVYCPGANVSSTDLFSNSTIKALANFITSKFSASISNVYANDLPDVIIAKENTITKPIIVEHGRKINWKMGIVEKIEQDKPFHNTINEKIQYSKNKNDHILNYHKKPQLNTTNLVIEDTIERNTKNKKSTVKYPNFLESKKIHAYRIIEIKDNGQLESNSKGLKLQIDWENKIPIIGFIIKNVTVDNTISNDILNSDKQYQWTLTSVRDLKTYEKICAKIGEISANLPEIFLNIFFKNYRMPVLEASKILLYFTKVLINSEVPFLRVQVVQSQHPNPLEGLARGFFKSLAAERPRRLQYVWTERLERLESLNVDLSYPAPRGAWIISGGTSGIGFEMAEYLIMNYNVSYVALLARHGVGNSVFDKEKVYRDMKNDTEKSLKYNNQQNEDSNYYSNNNRIKRLKQMRRFCQVNILQTDIRDFDTTRETFRKILDELAGRPLDGIIHSAGCTQDAPLDRLSENALDTVIGTKYMGLENIEKCLSEFRCKPTFFILNSSVSAAFGNATQCAYAAANAAADARLARLHERVSVIHWGNWLETGMAARMGVNPILNRGGLSGLKTRDALEYFRYILETSPAQILVADINWHRMLQIRPELKNILTPNFEAFLNQDLKIDQFINDQTILKNFNNPRLMELDQNRKESREPKNNHYGKTTLEELKNTELSRPTESLNESPTIREIKYFLTKILQKYLLDNEENRHDQKQDFQIKEDKCNEIDESIGFIELGLDSLKLYLFATELHENLKANYGDFTLSVIDLFQNPTLEKLTEYVYVKLNKVKFTVASEKITVNESNNRNIAEKDQRKVNTMNFENLKKYRNKNPQKYNKNLSFNQFYKEKIYQKNTKLAVSQTTVTDKCEIKQKFSEFMQHLEDQEGLYKLMISNHNFNLVSQHQVNGSIVIPAAFQIRQFEHYAILKLKNMKNSGKETIDNGFSINRIPLYLKHISFKQPIDLETLGHMIIREENILLKTSSKTFKEGFQTLGPCIPIQLISSLGEEQREFSSCQILNFGLNDTDNSNEFNDSGEVQIINEFMARNPFFEELLRILMDPNMIRSQKDIEPDYFYKGMRCNGIDYGSSFRLFKKITICEENFVIGEIIMDAISSAESSSASNWLLYEAAMQALSTVVFEYGNGCYYMPIQVDTFWEHGLINDTIEEKNNIVANNLQLINKINANITYDKPFQNDIYRINNEKYVKSVRESSQTDAVYVVLGHVFKRDKNFLQGTIGLMNQRENDAYNMVMFMETVTAIKRWNSQKITVSEKKKIRPVVQNLMRHNTLIEKNMEKIDNHNKECKTNHSMDTKKSEGPKILLRGWSRLMVEQITPKNFKEFDNEFFNINAKEAPYMDPQQRLLLEALVEAMECAQITRLPRATAVYVGASTCDFAQRAFAELPASGYLATGTNGSLLSGRLAHFLNITGPAETIDAACASFTVAVAKACETLIARRVDYAVVGAVNMLINAKTTEVLRQLGVLSSNDRCATFDAHADGYVRSDGVGVIILERIDSFEALRPLGYDFMELITISGWSVGHAGADVASLTASSLSTQRRVMREALARSQLCAADVDLVECHGSATPLGDPVEAASILETFINDSELESETSGPNLKRILLNASKSKFGHAEAAAGVTSLFEVLAIILSGRVESFRHFRVLNPKIRDLRNADKFLLPVIGMEVQIRNALINNFAFNGMNAALVLTVENKHVRRFGNNSDINENVVIEKNDVPEKDINKKNDEITVNAMTSSLLLLLSAKSRHSLETLCTRVNEFTRAHRRRVNSLFALCTTFMHHRMHYRPYRLAYLFDLTKNYNYTKNNAEKNNELLENYNTLDTNTIIYSPKNFETPIVLLTGELLYFATEIILNELVQNHYGFQKFFKKYFWKNISNKNLGQYLNLILAEFFVACSVTVANIRLDEVNRNYFQRYGSEEIRRIISTNCNSTSEYCGNGYSIENRRNDPSTNKKYDEFCVDFSEIFCLKKRPSMVLNKIFGKFFVLNISFDPNRFNPKINLQLPTMRFWNPWGSSLLKIPGYPFNRREFWPFEDEKQLEMSAEEPSIFTTIFEPTKEEENRNLGLKKFKFFTLNLLEPQLIKWNFPETEMIENILVLWSEDCRDLKHLGDEILIENFLKIAKILANRPRNKTTRILVLILNRISKNGPLNHDIIAKDRSSGLKLNYEINDLSDCCVINNEAANYGIEAFLKSAASEYSNFIYRVITIICNNIITDTIIKNFAQLQFLQMKQTENSGNFVTILDQNLNSIESSKTQEIEILTNANEICLLNPNPQNLNSTSVNSTLENMTANLVRIPILRHFVHRLVPVTTSFQDSLSSRIDFIGETVLITGGNGGLGRLLIEELVGAEAIIVVSRHATDSTRREDGNIRHYAADCANLVALSQVFRAEPAITIIIHCAGTVDNARVESFDSDQIKQVFSTKLSGTQNLLRLAAVYSIRRVIVVSSAAAILGSVGQANYAAANSLAARLCAHSNLFFSNYNNCDGNYRKPVIVRVCALGPLAGVGMLAGEKLRPVRAQIKDSGWRFLDAKCVARRILQYAMLEANANVPSQIFLFAAEWLKIRAKQSHLAGFLARFTEDIKVKNIVGMESKAKNENIQINKNFKYDTFRKVGRMKMKKILQKKVQLSPKVPQPSAISETTDANKIAEELCKLIRDVSGLVELRRDVGLMALGVDSLMIEEIRVAASRHFTIAISITEMFSHVTVDELSALVVTKLSDRSIVSETIKSKKCDKILKFKSNLPTSRNLIAIESVNFVVYGKKNKLKNLSGPLNKFQKKLEIPKQSELKSPSVSEIELKFIEKTQKKLKNSELKSLDLMKIDKDFEGLLKSDDVAIIGISGAFSGSASVEELWENLLSKKECFIKSGEALTKLKNPLEKSESDKTTNSKSESKSNEFESDNTEDSSLDLDHLGRNYKLKKKFIPISGLVPNAEAFDPTIFPALSPSETRMLDPHVRNIILQAYSVLEQSGYIRERSSLRVGCFIGAEPSGFSESSSSITVTEEPESESIIKSFSQQSRGDLTQMFRGNQKDFCAMWTSYLLDLKGPAAACYSACSSSLLAIKQASLALLDGQADLCLAGAVNLVPDSDIGHHYMPGMILAPRSECRPFGVQRDGGIVRGSGCAVVLLKRIQNALKDKDRILGVLKSCSITNDGASKSNFMAPGLAGQTRAMSDALKHAGISSDRVAYLECHATGTLVGDSIELQAISDVFSESQSCYKRYQKLRIGSIKANIGHAFAASGMASLAKCLKILESGRIPAQVGDPHTQIPILNESKWLEVSYESCNNVFGDQNPLKPRYLMLNSFGIGGTNASAVLMGVKALFDWNQNSNETLHEKENKDCFKNKSNFEPMNVFKQEKNENSKNFEGKDHIGKDSKINNTISYKDTKYSKQSSDFPLIDGACAILPISGATRDACVAQCRALARYIRLILEKCKKKYSDNFFLKNENQILTENENIAIKNFEESELNEDLNKLNDSASKDLIKDLIKEEQIMALKRIGYTLQFCRESFNYRIVIVAEGLEEAIQKLDQITGSDVMQILENDLTDHNLAAYFCPQGVQYPKMLFAELRYSSWLQSRFNALLKYFDAEEDENGRETLTRAITNNAIDDVRYAQCALYVVCRTAASFLAEAGLRPAVVFGHSMGEYAALAEANALQDAQCARILRARGRLMAKTTPAKMLLVHEALEDTEMHTAGVEESARLSERMRALVGIPTAIDVLRESLIARGATCRLLRTSYGFHSSFMDPIISEFRAELADTIGANSLPYNRQVISNVDGQILDSSRVMVDYLCQHLRQTVRLDLALDTLVARRPNIHVIVEFGPPTMLENLVLQRMADKSRNIHIIHTMSSRWNSLQDSGYGSARLFEAIGMLWARGFRVDFARLCGTRYGIDYEMPSYQFQLVVHRPRQILKTPKNQNGNRDTIIKLYRREFKFEAKLDLETMENSRQKPHLQSNLGQILFIALSYKALKLPDQFKVLDTIFKNTKNFTENSLMHSEKWLKNESTDQIDSITMVRLLYNKNMTFNQSAENQFEMSNDQENFKKFIKIHRKYYNTVIYYIEDYMEEDTVNHEWITTNISRTYNTATGFISQINLEPRAQIFAVSSADISNRSNSKIGPRIKNAFFSMIFATLSQLRHERGVKIAIIEGLCANGQIDVILGTIQKIQNLKKLRNSGEEIEWFWVHSGLLLRLFYETVETGLDDYSTVLSERISSQLILKEGEGDTKDSENIKDSKKLKKSENSENRENQSNSEYSVLFGGLGSIGAVYAQKIHRLHPEMKLVCASRRATSRATLPNDMTIYFDVDLADSIQVFNLFCQLIPLGKCRYVVHCAGIAPQKYKKYKTYNKSETQAEAKIKNNPINIIKNVDTLNQDNPEKDEMFSAKIYGTLNIIETLKKLKISVEVLILNSSLTAINGLPGAEKYAAANLFMSACSKSTAARIQALPMVRRTVSVEWPAWRDSEMFRKSTLFENTFVRSNSIGNEEAGRIIERVLLDPVIWGVIAVAGQNPGTIRRYFYSKFKKSIVRKDIDMMVEKFDLKHTIKQIWIDVLPGARKLMRDLLKSQKKNNNQMETLKKVQDSIGVQIDTDLIKSRKEIQDQKLTNESLENSKNEDWDQQDFFALGGNSLSAVQVAWRAERVLGTKGARISAEWLFEFPRFSDFCDKIQSVNLVQNNEALTQTKNLENQRNPTDYKDYLEVLNENSNPNYGPLMIPEFNKIAKIPLSLPQEQMWLLWSLNRDQAQVCKGLQGLYNIVFRIDFSGLQLNVAALEWSLRRVLALQTSFRTRFQDGDAADLSQEILSLTESYFSLEWSDSRKFEEIIIAGNEECKFDFDLVEIPLRIRVFRIIESECQRTYSIILSQHHILTDGWSMTVFAKELSNAYKSKAARNSISSYDSENSTAFNNLQDNIEPEYLNDLGLESFDQPNRISYSDYAAWNRAQFETNVMTEKCTELMEIFKKLSCDGTQIVADAHITLPNSQKCIQFARDTICLDVPLATRRALDAFCACEQATRYLVVMLAFARTVDIWRADAAVTAVGSDYSNPIVIGCAVAGRASAQVADLVGYFLNNVILLFNSHELWRDDLQAVRRAVASAQRFADVPFHRAVAALYQYHTPRNLLQNPVFQIFFNYRHNLDFPMVNAGRGVHTETTQLSTNRVFQFSCTVDEIQNGNEDLIRLTIDYDATRYSRNTIESFAAEMVEILDRLVRRQNQKILYSSEFSTENERLEKLNNCVKNDKENILANWIEYANLGDIMLIPNEIDLMEAICLQARMSPQKPAIKRILSTGLGPKSDQIEEKILSYSNLIEQVEANANWLKELYFRVSGLMLGPDRVVPLIFADNNEVVLWILTVLYTGAAYSILDARSPLVRISNALHVISEPIALSDTVFSTLWRDKINTKIFLVTEIESNSKLSLAQDHTYSLKRIRRTIKFSPNDWVPTQRKNSSQDLAYVCFTSGTTGVPKGVCVDRANILAFVRGATRTLLVDANSLVAHSVNCAFDVSVFNVFCTLLNGACLVQMNSIMSFVTPSELETFVNKTRCSKLFSHLFLNSAMFNELNEPELRYLARRATENLIVGGETPRTSSMEICLPYTRLTQIYGPTETTVWSILEHVKRDSCHGTIIGTVAPNEVAVLLHASDPAVVLSRNSMAVGELCLAGIGVTRGYLRDWNHQAPSKPGPTNTQINEKSLVIHNKKLIHPSNTIVPITMETQELSSDPFISLPGLGRAYRTGDLMRRVARDSHGNWRFMYLGRNDARLKIGGMRVDPAEVSEAIASEWRKIFCDLQASAIFVIGENLKRGEKEFYDKDLKNFVTVDDDRKRSLRASNLIEFDSNPEEIELVAFVSVNSSSVDFQNFIKVSEDRIQKDNSDKSTLLKEQEILELDFVEPDKMLTLKSALAELLPANAIPSAFILIKRMPLTRVGKVDRLRLHDIYVAWRSERAAPHTALTSKNRRDFRNAVAKKSYENDNLENSYHAISIENIFDRLKSIWRDLLSIKTEDVLNGDTNFFALGGHSLLLLRLKRSIQDEFSEVCNKTQFRIDELYGNATLGSQSTLIYFRLKNTVTEALKMDYGNDSFKSPNMVDVISLLRNVPFTVPKESILNVYCIHAIGGTLFSYYPILHVLPDNWRVYGIHYDPEIEAETLDELAQFYANKILANELRPLRRFLLLGHSLGGILAREVALVLNRMSEVPATFVPFIVAIDSWVLATKSLDLNAVRLYLIDQFTLMPNKASLLRGAMRLARMLVAHNFRHDAVVGIRLFKATEWNGELALRNCIRDMSLSQLTAAYDNGWSSYADSVTVYPCNGNHDSVLRYNALAPYHIVFQEFGDELKNFALDLQ